MTSYVVYGRRAAMAIHRSHAATKEETGNELRKEAMPVLGEVIGWHPAFDEESAVSMALAYTAEKLKSHPLTKQELRWIEEGMRQEAAK